jgi:hypothetical protein
MAVARQALDGEKRVALRTAEWLGLGDDVCHR